MLADLLPKWLMFYYNQHFISQKEEHPAISHGNDQLLQCRCSFFILKRVNSIAKEIYFMWNLNQRWWKKFWRLKCGWERNVWFEFKGVGPGGCCCERPLQHVSYLLRPSFIFLFFLKNHSFFLNWQYATWHKFSKHLLVRDMHRCPMHPFVFCRHVF